MNPKLSIEEKLKHLDKLELLQAYSNIQEVISLFSLSSSMQVQINLTYYNKHYKTI